MTASRDRFPAIRDRARERPANGKFSRLFIPNNGKYNGKTWNDLLLHTFLRNVLNRLKERGTSLRGGGQGGEGGSQTWLEIKQQRNGALWSFQKGFG